MNTGILFLSLNAAIFGFIHTLIGPDHYVPFVAMARARRWSTMRTAWITLVCGVGHIASAAALGLLGIACGVSLNKIAHVESVGGSLAAWALIAFGAVYLVWGLRRAYQRQTDEHNPMYGGASGASLAPWVLFTIFVFGPCETMIPLMMIPAAGHDWAGVVLVTVVFGAVTMATMLALVQLGLSGVRLVSLKGSERFGHALAGGVILLTGGAVQIFGL